MSDDGQSDQPIKISQSETRSLWPFLLAAGVILVVIIGIVVAALVSPVEKNVTDRDRLAVAASAFTQSRSGTDVLDPNTVCQGFDENRSPLSNPRDEGVQFEFVRLDDPVITGDRATAQVTYRADGAERTATWTFTRSGSRWLVCD
ncbi:Rv0361 family membrane protein [Nocardia sp. IFM 10818]